MVQYRMQKWTPINKTVVHLDPNFFVMIDNWCWNGYSFIVFYTAAFRANFHEFSCWEDLFLSKFQNQFCAASTQLGQKCELESLFNTKITASLQVGDFILVKMIKIKSTLKLLVSLKLLYTVEEGEIEPKVWLL